MVGSVQIANRVKQVSLMFHWFKRHDKKGAEVPDPTPIEIPLNGHRPLTLAQQIERFCRSPEANKVAVKHGADTFDEADDFDIPDDDSTPDFVSRYPTTDMSDEVPTRIAEIEAGHVQPMPPERAQKVQERVDRARLKAMTPKTPQAQPDAQ